MTAGEIEYYTLEWLSGLRSRAYLQELTDVGLLWAWSVAVDVIRGLFGDYLDILQQEILSRGLESRDLSREIMQNA